MSQKPRFERWISASFVTARYQSFLPVTVQGLGFLDEELFQKDQLIIQGIGLGSSDEEIMAFNRHITLSYLWVLGAYEVIRAIKERCKDLKSPDAEVIKIHETFRRLRIPLAKLEASRGYEESDVPIAYPALNSQYGIAWQVSEDVFIPRGALADDLLTLLESKRAQADIPRPLTDEGYR
jgi:hypothetical protein